MEEVGFVTLHWPHGRGHSERRSLYGETDEDVALKAEQPAELGTVSRLGTQQ